jgi:hypothetical protein
MSIMDLAPSTWAQWPVGTRRSEGAEEAAVGDAQQTEQTTACCGRCARRLATGRASAQDLGL